ncbi:MAG: pilus assembly protein [Chloroflexi bacterium]|nr:pilus assembly protein [Chloroflexota bacterium]MBF6607004.1 pilus assembly protein [Chloroflexota bacterium]
MALIHRSDSRSSARLAFERGAGQSVVEFAVLLPLFMLLLLVTVDFGRLFFSYIQITNAAREGAAYAAVDPTNLAAITTRATAEANSQAQGGEHPIAVTTACVDTTGATIPCSGAPGGGGPGYTVTVTASEVFSFLTPWMNGLLGNNFTMSTSASAVALGLAPNSSATQPPGCAAPSSAVMSVAGSGLTIDVDGSASQPSSGLCHISGYNWSFGDGTTDVSYATGTVHTYAFPGVYVVTLTVTNQGGTATTTSTVTVPLSTTCLAPHAAFSIAPPTGSAGSSGTIFGFDASASTNMGVEACHPHYTWDFGDGATGPDAPTTTHQYVHSAPGTTVRVRLTVSNDAGSGQSTQTITLQ